MLDLLAGAISMGFALGALFFLKFWRESGERLFLAFAGSFALLSIAQMLLTLMPVPLEERSWVYLLRLLAFTLIIVAVWRHNRAT